MLYYVLIPSADSVVLVSDTGQNWQLVVAFGLNTESPASKIYSPRHLNRRKAR